MSLTADFPDKAKPGATYDFRVDLENTWEENAYKYKFEIYINGSLYTRKTKILDEGDKIVVDDSFTQPQQGSDWEIKTWLEWGGDWVDDDSITRTVKVEEDEDMTVNGSLDIEEKPPDRVDEGDTFNIKANWTFNNLGDYNISPTIKMYLFNYNTKLWETTGSFAHRDFIDLYERIEGTGDEMLIRIIVKDMDNDNIIDDYAKTVEVISGESAPEHCDKSDLATNWDDKTYTDPNCGLPEGYKAVKTFYSEEPINIEKTDVKTSENAPTIQCNLQWDQWEGGFMRTAQKCSKDNYWYWVDYNAELIEKEKEPSVNVTKLYVNPDEVKAGNSTEVIARFDLSGKGTTVELDGKPDYYRTTLTESKYFDIGTHEIRLEIPTTEDVEGDKYISIKLYKEVNDNMREVDSQTISFTVNAPAPEFDTSKVYLTELSVEKKEVGMGDYQKITGRIQNDHDGGIMSDIKLDLFNGTYKTTVNCGGNNSRSFELRFQVPDLDIPRGGSKSVSGSVTVLAEKDETEDWWGRIS